MQVKIWFQAYCMSSKKFNETCKCCFSEKFFIPTSFHKLVKFVALGWFDSANQYSLFNTQTLTEFCRSEIGFGVINFKLLQTIKDIDFIITNINQEFDKTI